MDWARKYPSESTLLGVSPIDPDKLITKSEFNKRLLEIDKFEEQLMRKDVIVLDVRDRFQREGVSLFPGIDKRAYLDDKTELEKYMHTAINENKTLLIYDATGKQVRWLMYSLQEMGVKNYFFMKGGANAYYAKMMKKLTN